MRPRRCGARHARWFADFARRAGRGLYSAEELVWDERLRPEVDNLQVAVAWAVGAGDTDTAMRIGGSFPRGAVARPLLGTAHLAGNRAAAARRHPGNDPPMHRGVGVPGADHPPRFPGSATSGRNRSCTAYSAERQATARRDAARSRRSQRAWRPRTVSDWPDWTNHCCAYWRIVSNIS